MAQRALRFVARHRPARCWIHHQHRTRAVRPAVTRHAREYCRRSNYSVYDRPLRRAAQRNVFCDRPAARFDSRFEYGTGYRHDSPIGQQRFLLSTCHSNGWILFNSLRLSMDCGGSEHFGGNFLIRSESRSAAERRIVSRRVPPRGERGWSIRGVL